jgi:PAS domain S-box-containing protein
MIQFRLSFTALRPTVMPSSADIHHLRNRIWLVAGMFIVLIFLFVWYVSAEKEINNANMNSFISLSLAILIAFVALGAFMLWTIRSIYLARVDAARKTAEDTLASTSQRLSNIINATQVGTWERNIQTGAMLINDRWANMLGYTITELEPISSSTWMRLIHPDDLEQVEILQQMHFEGDVPVFECKTRMQHKLGHSIWVLSRGSLLSRTPDEAPEWMAGSDLDISATENANAQLHENEQQLRVMLSEMPIGVALIDANGKIFFRNRHLIELLGYTDIDVPDLKSWWIAAYPDPVYRAEIMQIWEAALRAAKDGKHIITAHTYTVTALNGCKFEVQISGIATRFGFLATFVDQTETRQIQLQLEEAKSLADSNTARLGTAAKVAELGIWELHLNDKSVLWDSRMFDIYQAPDHLRESGSSYEFWRSRVHPEDVGEAEAKLAAAINGSGAYDPIFRIIVNDNKVRYIQADGKIERDKNGKAVKVVGINRDITQQYTLERSLRNAKREADAANEAKSAFLATMSHEIRTPISGMLGMIKLLTHTDLTAQQLDYAKKAENATKALLGIINDILDFSKIEAGKFELDYASFELGDLLHDLSVVLSSNLSNKYVEVLFKRDPRVPAILIGDQLRLSQILLNLAGNAIKFTNKGAVILAITQVNQTLSQAGNRRIDLEFSVQDTGIGIAPDKLLHIFDSFSQAESSTARRFGGTGLGLAISKRLVAMMGGDLQVDSTLDKGSRFYFTLSLDSPAAQPKVELNEKIKQLRILIVDDNAISREILTSMCNSLGWSNDAVDSGEAALAKLKQTGVTHYDVILMDWRMPGLDGWETVRQIRSMREGGTEPVIVMITAHGLEFFNQKSKNESNLFIDGYLFKPITASMLFDTVIDATATRQGISTRSTATVETRHLNGKRILVVEDNRLNQQIAKELLELNGAVVDIASDGMSGVEQALTNKPDVILMDMQMPDIDGLEATRRILREPAMQAIPIIAITANAMNSDREACLAAGMVDHISKPIDLDKLIKSIMKHTTPNSQPVQESNFLHNDADKNTGKKSDNTKRLVDVELAVNRIGGNRQFYEKLIVAVRSDGQTQLKEFKNFLAQGDLASAARCLHTFKGLVATLGAESLAQLAASTEKIIKQGEPGVERDALIAPRIAEIENLLQQVMQELDAIPHSDYQKAELIPIAGHNYDQMDADQRKASLQQELGTLMDFLRTNNMRSVAICTEIKREHSNWLNIKELDLLLDIDETVNQLNFNHALALCNNLIEIIE